ncbi:RAxF-45 family protein [Peribacillus deserti]
MNRFIGLRAQFLNFIYICRAIFHEAIFQGGSLPFFRNCISQ